jgi:hypothetical protein
LQVVDITVNAALQNQIIGHLVAHLGLVPLVVAQMCFLAVGLRR